VTQGTATARRILVVEDELEIADVERNILTAEGFAVDIARDGVEALERLAATRYHGIVLDANLPGVDGYEVASRLRGLPLNRTTPIVMVTASLEPDARQRGFELGISGFIAKPFNPGTFRALISSLAQ
jgi:two-component system, OmpR family, response regulator ResD